MGRGDGRDVEETDAGAPEVGMPGTDRGKPVAFLLSLAAWLVPGAGHALLGRWGRAGVFASLVVTFTLVGCGLGGHLYTFDTAVRLLHYLASLGAMGMGTIYFLLDGVLGYQGPPAAPTHEYGTAFLLTAGLMNLLLILDSWDIARGYKA